MKPHLLLLAAHAACAPRSTSLAPVVTQAGRAATTLTGQPIGFPDPVEVVVSTSDIPAGGALPMHKHPWPRTVYVERGRIRVRYESPALVRELGPGEAVVEGIDQWHDAQAVGQGPVRLIIVDHVPPGRTNLVRR